MSQTIAEIQQITAGNDFDGTAPLSSVPVHTHNGARVYNPAAAGGLFALLHDDSLSKATYKRKREVTTILLHGNASWSVYVTDGITDILWFTASGSDIVMTDHIDLLPNEYLKVVSSGAAVALKAQVQYEVFDEVA